MAADKQLIIETTDGGKTVFALSNNPEISFNGQTMLLAVGSQSHSYEIANVAQYYFGTIESGIGILKGTRFHIRNIGNDQIVIEGITPKTDVRLYSLNGTQKTCKVVLSSDKATISLTTLPKGIYIISVNQNQIIKIHRK